jgi:sugar phosphate isomerase/epimerase
MRPPPTDLRFGYGTNGFTHHRLTDVLTVLADLGYDGVALTLDHGHLDPYADDLPRRVAALARQLARHGLEVTVETGAPYFLDPWGKHLPTLLSDGSEHRVDLLRSALRIAADLGSPTVHLCSGPAPDGLPERDAWKRLAAGVETVLETAETYGVALVFEPARPLPPPAAHRVRSPAAYDRRPARPGPLRAAGRVLGRLRRHRGRDLHLVRPPRTARRPARRRRRRTRLGP